MRIVPAILLALASYGFAGEYKLGWKSDPKHKDGLKQIVHAPGFKAAPLPSAASVRAGVRPIYNQGDIGSCTANAGASAFDYAWRVKHGSFVDLSRLDLYQQSLKHDGSWPADAGSYTSTVLWVLKTQGVCREVKWKYVPTNLPVNPPSCAVRDRSAHMAVKAYDVPNNDNGASVKACIANLKIPVLTGGYVFNDIFKPKKDAATGKYYVPNPRGNPVGGHEILIVSYDDTLTIAGKTGWAEIVNSWGESWGDKGTAWVSYSYIFNPKYFEDNGVIEISK